jgi:RNA-binding protein
VALTGKQKRFLRAEAHHLSPLVVVGKVGLTDTVIAALAAALLDHELVKVRVLETAPVTRGEAGDRLVPRTRSDLVGQVGRVLILYKRHPEKPVIRLPGA